MKSQRQQKILELIEKYDIATQEELIARLNDFGYKVTQTTISRDIKQLKLVKGLSAGGVYKYIVPSVRKEHGNTPILSATISASVVSAESAQNIVVVKTTPGMANAVAICIESLHLSHIVGNIAGDDTLLLVMKDTQSAEDAEQRLRITFGK